MLWANNEIGLDSSQKRSKCLISGLKIALASQHPKFAVPWKWWFSAKPFCLKTISGIFLIINTFTEHYWAVWTLISDIQKKPLSHFCLPPEGQVVLLFHGERFYFFNSWDIHCLARLGINNYLFEKLWY